MALKTMEIEAAATEGCLAIGALINMTAAKLDFTTGTQQRCRYRTDRAGPAVGVSGRVPGKVDGGKRDESDVEASRGRGDMRRGADRDGGPGGRVAPSKRTVQIRDENRCRTGNREASPPAASNAILLKGYNANAP